MKILFITLGIAVLSFSDGISISSNIKNLRQIPKAMTADIKDANTFQELKQLKHSTVVKDQDDRTTDGFDKNKHSVKDLEEINQLKRSTKIIDQDRTTDVSDQNKRSVKYLEQFKEVLRSQHLRGKEEEDRKAQEESCAFHSFEALTECLVKSYPSVYDLASIGDSWHGFEEVPPERLKQDHWVGGHVQGQDYEPDELEGVPAHAAGCLLDAVMEYTLCAIADGADMSTKHGHGARDLTYRNSRLSRFFKMITKPFFDFIQFIKRPFASANINQF